MVYAKQPFAGPKQVLRLSRRATPIASPSPTADWSPLDDDAASPSGGRTTASTAPTASKTMTLAADEFIRRFLIHVLPKGFHRIRHYGLLANGNRAANVARSRELLGAMPRVVEPEEEQAATPDEPRV